MAINVSGANPTSVTAVSDTTTTNTTFNTTPPNDRNYVFADTISAAINAGVVVSGFELRLETTLADTGNLVLFNDGSVAINQATPAVELVGNGGSVSYGGTGSITNDNGPGLTVTNSGSGFALVSIHNNVFSNNAVHNDADGDIVSWTMQDNALFDTTSFGAAPDTWELVGTGEFELA